MNDKHFEASLRRYKSAIARLEKAIQQHGDVIRPLPRKVAEACGRAAMATAQHQRRFYRFRAARFSPRNSDRQ